MPPKKREPAGSWNPPETFRNELADLRRRGLKKAEEDGWEVCDVVEEHDMRWRPIQWGYQFLTSLGTVMSWFPTTRTCIWYEPHNVFAHINDRDLLPADMLLEICSPDIRKEFRGGG